MRVLLDTNVLLSAFLTDGVCARILKKARRRRFTFILCSPVLREIERLLRTKFSLSEDELHLFLSILQESAAEMHHPIGNPPGICRDPDDDWLLLCAAQTDAAFLVSGDRDLLVLEEYGQTTILSPRDFELLFRD